MDLSEREMKVKDQRIRTTATDESTAAAMHQAPVSYDIVVGFNIKKIALKMSKMTIYLGGLQTVIPLHTLWLMAV